MELLLKTVAILIIIFGYHFSWAYYYRSKDLIWQLTILLRELAKDEYDMRATQEGDATVIELTNAYTRIRYTQKKHAGHEELAFSLFFKNAEYAGASQTWITFPHGRLGKWKPALFQRTNAWGGRLVYFVHGIIFGGKVFRLMNDIRTHIFTQRHKAAGAV